MHENVYAKLLLPKGNGYPLWIPEPDENLPPEYCEQGVSIGDVGIITPEGGFDVLFNICQSATHPINDDSVPQGFTPFSFEDGDVAKESCWWPPGTVIVSSNYTDGGECNINTGAAKTKVGNFPDVFKSSFSHSAIINCNFSFESDEGAFLVLPDGARREDLVHFDGLRAYMRQNTETWPEFAKARRGRMADNDLLLLVTGCDKAKSWAVGSLSGPSKMNLAGRAGNMSYSLQSECSVSPQMRFSPATPSDTENQCIFLRGVPISSQSTGVARVMTSSRLEKILIACTRCRQLKKKCKQVGRERCQRCCQTEQVCVYMDVIDGVTAPRPPGSSPLSVVPDSPSNPPSDPPSPALEIYQAFLPSSEKLAESPCAFQLESNNPIHHVRSNPTPSMPNVPVQGIETSIISLSETDRQSASFPPLNSFSEQPLFDTTYPHSSQPRSPNPHIHGNEVYNYSAMLDVHAQPPFSFAASANQQDRDITDTTQHCSQPHSHYDGAREYQSDIHVSPSASVVSSNRYAPYGLPLGLSIPNNPSTPDPQPHYVTSGTDGTPTTYSQDPRANSRNLSCDSCTDDVT